MMRMIVQPAIVVQTVFAVEQISVAEPVVKTGNALIGVPVLKDSKPALAPAIVLSQSATGTTPQENHATW